MVALPAWMVALPGFWPCLAWPQFNLNWPNLLGLFYPAHCIFHPKLAFCHPSKQFWTVSMAPPRGFDWSKCRCGQAENGCEGLWAKGLLHLHLLLLLFLILLLFLLHLLLLLLKGLSQPLAGGLRSLRRDLLSNLNFCSEPQNLKSLQILWNSCNFHKDSFGNDKMPSIEQLLLGLSYGWHNMWTAPCSIGK